MGRVRPAHDKSKNPRALLLQVGKHAEAATQIQTVLAAGPDPEAYWLLSRAALQAGTDMLTALKQSGTYADEYPLAPEPAPYIGEAACAACHPMIAELQQTSPHARTFQRNPHCFDLAIPGRPIADPANPNVIQKIECPGSKIRFQAISDQVTTSGIVDFVFGSGNHATTYVGHDAGARAGIPSVALCRRPGLGFDERSRRQILPTRKDS